MLLYWACLFNCVKTDQSTTVESECIRMVESVYGTGQLFSTPISPCKVCFKASSHRKNYRYEKIKLKIGEDYEILGKTFSNLFKKQDFQIFLKRYYLRFIFFPCLKPLLRPLVFQSSLCEPGNRKKSTDGTP